MGDREGPPCWLFDVVCSEEEGISSEFAKIIFSFSPNSKSISSLFSVRLRPARIECLGINERETRVLNEVVRRRRCAKETIRCCFILSTTQGSSSAVARLTNGTRE